MCVCMRQQLGQPASLATAAPATLQKERGERENAGGEWREKRVRGIERKREREREREPRPK